MQWIFAQSKCALLRCTIEFINYFQSISFVLSYFHREFSAYFFIENIKFEQILSEYVIGFQKFFRKFPRQDLQGQLQVAYT